METINLLKNNYGGKLIVFEGIDGSGKTTLINNLIKYLQTQKYEYLYVKMPSDRIRALKLFNDYDNSNDSTTRNTINLTNLTIMVSGDRLLQQDEQIIPALKQEKIVICDRYCFTGYVRCNDNIIKQICERFIKPSLTFVCDCEVNIAKQRVKQRTIEINNYYDEADVKQQKHNFLDLAKNNNFVVVNTNLDIEKSIKQIIKSFNQILF